MNFEINYLYHIYNQGNNKRNIFFNKANYHYFIKKMYIYIKPYADILAWCLMPNHFHILVRIKQIEMPVDIEQMTQGHLFNKKRTFNNSIAIMLRSYTRAVNKQEGMSGSLFRAKTKAECVNCIKEITPSFVTNNGITESRIINTTNQYPQVCFNYIHQNPVKAGIVKIETDWEFSSARDYAGMRKGKLINKKCATKYLLI